MLATRQIARAPTTGKFGNPRKQISSWKADGFAIDGLITPFDFPAAPGAYIGSNLSAHCLASFVYIFSPSF
jgi:hypothetical protein